MPRHRASHTPFTTHAPETDTSGGQEPPELGEVTVLSSMSWDSADACRTLCTVLPGSNSLKVNEKMQWTKNQEKTDSGSR